jgi:hypothetical protein
MRHIIRGWQQEGDNKPVVLPVGKFGGTAINFIPGPLNDVKELEPKLVDSKLGKQKCKGVTGRLQAERGTTTQETIYESRLHDKAPFGVVTCSIQLRVIRDGKIVRKLDWAFKLADFGKDAKSQLPEHN